MKRLANCSLCGPVDPATVVLVAEKPKFRVVRVIDNPGFPAFYRVVWKDHVVEMSDLRDADRVECGDAVTAVERVLRQLAPAKINIAALGNVVPHLHWHVIARFEWDSHYPQPIWGSQQREVEAVESRLSMPLISLDQRLHSVFAGWGQ